MSMLSMQYAGTLIGREAVIDFPDSKADVRYTPQGQMVWHVVDSLGHVSDGCERLSYLQVSDSLHFLNWIEKTGFTVSQVIDTAQGTVRFDNFGGRWGAQAKFEQFIQAYAVEKAKLEARRQGHAVTEQTLADGSIKLSIAVGGHA